MTLWWFLNMLATLILAGGVVFLAVMGAAGLIDWWNEL